jgi:hypothetical protein
MKTILQQLKALPAYFSQPALVEEYEGDFEGWIKEAKRYKPTKVNHKQYNCEDRARCPWHAKHTPRKRGK